MSTTQIIPKLEFERPLETAFAANDQFLVRLAPLKQQVAELTINSKEDYEQMGRILSEVRSIRKNEVQSMWAPFTGLVQRVKDALRQEQQKVENLCEEIDGSCKRKMKDWEIAEAIATAKEQKKHPEGQVQPDLPAVDGYRRSTTYPVTVADPKALLRELLRCYKKGDKERVKFLEQFVMLDVKACEAHARKTKNPVQFNKEMPGMTCIKDGA